MVGVFYFWHNGVYNMRKKKVGFELTIFNSIKDLPTEFQQLMQKAEQAREKAYAPYSNFLVGAAVLLKNGEVIVGNNQENAAYPSGLCAERVAVYQAGAQFPSIPITAIATSARSKNYKVSVPVTSCGSCRQAMAEYEQKQNAPIRLFFMGQEGEIYGCGSVSDILPLAFGNSFLTDS